MNSPSSLTSPCARSEQARAKWTKRLLERLRGQNNHHRYQQTDRQEINPAELPRGTGSLSPKAGLASGRVVNPGPALPWRSCRVRNNNKRSTDDA